MRRNLRRSSTTPQMLEFTAMATFECNMACTTQPSIPRGREVNTDQSAAMLYDWE